MGASITLLLLLGGCAPDRGPMRPTPTARSLGTVVADVDFGGPTNILLDVCLPPRTPESVDAAATGRVPAVLSVHGGGWHGGDKAAQLWRETCTWLASEGFVVFQANYRLAPAHPFPAALDDLETAVDWIGDEEQARRFGYDPERLAAFGDSAGGNLVSLLAVSDPAPSARLRAVVELSAPLDLTRGGIALGDLDARFQRVQLDYLGCASYDDCAAALPASPLHAVDTGDPPFFVVSSTEDFIPVEQADAFVERLEASSVDVVYERVPGSAHALDLLDDPLRERIAGWLHRQLD